MIFEGILDYVIVVFLVLVFAEYIKIRSKFDKQFLWVALGAFFLLLVPLFGILGLGFWTYVTGVAPILAMLFEFLGFLFILVGVLWLVIKVLFK